MKNMKNKEKIKEQIPTIIIMRGLPASGKSTMSNEILQSNYEKLNIYRVNKSNIREMLWPQHKWTRLFENHIQIIEEQLVKIILKAKYSVIIDSTNLKSRDILKWKNLAKELKCKIKIYDFRYIDIETCIERDFKRKENSVGPKVIFKLARENGLLK